MTHPNWDDREWLRDDQIIHADTREEIMQAALDAELRAARTRLAAYALRAKCVIMFNEASDCDAPNWVLHQLACAIRRCDREIERLR